MTGDQDIQKGARPHGYEVYESSIYLYWHIILLQVEQRAEYERSNNMSKRISDHGDVMHSSL